MIVKIISRGIILYMIINFKIIIYEILKQYIDDGRCFCFYNVSQAIPLLISWFFFQFDFETNISKIDSRCRRTSVPTAELTRLKNLVHDQENQILFLQNQMDSAEPHSLSLDVLKQVWLWNISSGPVTNDILFFMAI